MSDIPRFFCFIHSYYRACSSRLSNNKIYLKLTIVTDMKLGETF